MRNQQERGVRKAYPDLRCGVTTPRLKGIVRTPDSSAVPDESFHEVVNGRLVGGRLVNRGGQARVNTGGVTDGCPEFIFDCSDLGAEDPFTLLTSGMIYEIESTAASYNWFSYYMPNGANPTQVVVPDLRYVFFAHPFSARGKLVIGPSVPSVGGDNVLYWWSATDGLQEAYRHTTPYVGVHKGVGWHSGVEFEGNFYLSVFYHQDALPHSEHMLIYRWDGVSDPVLEFDYAAIQHTAMNIIDDLTTGVGNTWALYTDGLAVYALPKVQAYSYGNPANVVAKRDSSTGTWNIQTLPDCNFFGTSSLDPGISYGQMVRYGSATYICGNDYNALFKTATQKTLKILRNDGSGWVTVWSRANTPYLAQSSGDPSIISIFVNGDKLYYNYADNAAGVYKTGSYDGATWNDNFKTWSAAPQSLTEVPFNVVESDGSLWAALSGNIVKTAGLTEADVSGTWTNINGTYHGRYIDVSR